MNLSIHFLFHKKERLIMGLVHHAASNTLMFSFTAFGLASLASAYKPFPKEFSNSASCEVAESLKDQVHPRENKLRDLLSPSFYERWFGNPAKPEEYLSLDKNCKKDKFLFLSAIEDHNGALDPKNILSMLKEINKKYDLKYKVVGSEEDVCWHVQKAAEMGKLTNVVINAHSDSQAMCLSKCEDHSGWLSIYKNYTECFKGVDLLGRITLFGSKAGISADGNPKNNIAQKIATDSKREVIAPMDYISSSGIEVPNTKDFELYQKAGSTQEGQKVFKLFQPVYEKCTNVVKHTLHQREKDAVEAIWQKTTSSSYLVYPDEFEDSILKLCKDNQKKKFLFLSAEHDWNNALNPKKYAHLFESLSKKYDFKFKLVRSYDDICKEIQESEKFGEIVHLVINAHGERRGIQIGDQNNNLDDWLHKEKDLLGYRDNLDCLKDISKSARITLLSCNSSQPNGEDVNDNFASFLSKKTEKEVVAPIEEISGEGIKISENAFDVSHASRRNPKEMNVFKKFNPQRLDDKP